MTRGLRFWAVDLGTCRGALGSGETGFELQILAPREAVLLERTLLRIAGGLQIPRLQEEPGPGGSF